MAQTLVPMPATNLSLLTHAYADAFQTLMHVLIAITLLSALVILILLGTPPLASKGVESALKRSRW